jgi:hypothetical protein
LNLLASTPEVVAVQTATRTSIPRVLLFDDTNHVLIITDLGNDLLTLDQWLLPPLLNPSSEPNSSEIKTTPEPELCNNVGARLGALLAAVHGMNVSRAVLEQFKNEEAKRLIRCQVIDNVSRLLQKPGLDEIAEKGERQKCCAAIEADFEEECKSGGRLDGVFSVGDLWTGSVLVSPNGETVGLVDLEFAGEGSALQDIAELGSLIQFPITYQRLTRY